MTICFSCEQNYIIMFLFVCFFYLLFNQFFMKLYFVMQILVLCNNLLLYFDVLIVLCKC